MVAKVHSHAIVCEAVAVIRRENGLHFVIDQFQRSGFDRSVLSVLSHMEPVEKLPGNLFPWVGIQHRKDENRAREILARFPARAQLRKATR